jgi:hypothetical protein
MANISFLVIITLATLLMVNAVAIGAGTNIALARHHDNTRVRENSHINVQTETGQSQDCETASGNSPISDSCTASSSDRITQGAVPSSPSPSSCTSTVHPTVLTLNLPPPNTQPGGKIQTAGKLIDTCTGQGVAATIRFTFQFPSPPGFGLIGQGITMTATNGVFGLTIGVPFQAIVGTGTVGAQFSGQGIFGPSSATQSFSVS